VGVEQRRDQSMQDKKIRYKGRKGSLMRFAVNGGLDVSSTRTNTKSALEWYFYSPRALYKEREKQEV
jgi:hypothetical protein